MIMPLSDKRRSSRLELVSQYDSLALAHNWIGEAIQVHVAAEHRESVNAREESSSDFAD